METNETEKILQIIPVNGEVFAVFKQENDSEWWDPIFFAALVVDGKTRFLRYVDICPEGIQGFPDDNINFLRYEYPTAKSIKPRKSVKDIK